jgi:hypothetical protein
MSKNIRKQSSLNFSAKRKKKKKIGGKETYSAIEVTRIG